MSGRYKTKPDLPLSSPLEPGKLPTDQCVAAYYRQSTTAQVGNISTDIQTIDLPAYLKGLGWPSDKIILIDTDEGVSGQLKIDERTGMRYLADLIIGSKVKAVACQDEDRLFRDQSQIQVNIFIEMCKKHRVLVVTPNIVYDFAHPLLGSFHIKQFRYKCEMAADYITTVVLGKLALAKTRLAMDGRWSGGKMPVGYMADMRKMLPDGSRNPSWRKFVPFDPYAQVVTEYFQLLIRFNFSVYRTLNHIKKHGPWYPECAPPEGFKISYSLKAYRREKCPTLGGLRYALTNTAYIGHWTYQDVVIKWNNHPAIVSESVFMRVFNRLCAIGLDGEDNPEFKPIRENARPTLDEGRHAERPLLSGTLRSQGDSNVRVATVWECSCGGYYKYVATAYPVLDGSFLWSRQAKSIDNAVADLVKAKLSSTFDDKSWHDAIDTIAEHARSKQKLAIAQIEALDITLANLVESLSHLRLPELIRQVEEQYERTKTERERLQHGLSIDRQQSAYLDAIFQLRDKYQLAISSWDDQSQDEKRTHIQVFVDFVDIEPTDYGTNISVHWRDSTHNGLFIRRPGKGPAWLAEELEQLRQLVGDGASQLTIASVFPDRTWKAIVHKITKLTGGYFKVGRGGMREQEKYADFMLRTNSPLPSTSDKS